ncbi:MAG: hypothetical protein ACQERZ_08855 [Fusobacteriota bacterium]
MKKYILSIIAVLFMMGCTTTEIKEKEVENEKRDIGPYNEKLFLMGDMNNWRKSTKFRYMGDGVYLAKIYLYEGAYRFNISNLDETKVFIKKDKNGVPLNQEVKFKKKEIKSGNLKENWNILSLKKSKKADIKLIVKNGDLENPYIKIELEEDDDFIMENEEILEWRGEKAEIKIINKDEKYRKYNQRTTKKLRDNDPRDKKIQYEEKEGQMRVRTNNVIFDGLFTLAMDEVEKNSVEEIKDGAFNNGDPVKYKAFETGAKWHYVWTRDTAYSVNLSLGMVDPERSMNSLLYKVSEKRTDVKDHIKPGMEIIQDTGSGGSWPISTDRVTWALGAWETLKYLDGENKKEFYDTSYEAIKNTIENDRISVFDKKDGLYRGEQSFLDWREQSYPTWTAQNTVHIGMSKVLSTNAAHYGILKIASVMAYEKNDLKLAKKYEKWAMELKESINREFWLESEGMYGSMKTTELDNSVSKKFDLLGESLAIILGIADLNKAKKIIENYPHSQAGPPVIAPQIPDIPIYHNRGMWPFVTAYFLKGAKRVKNHAAVTHDMMSMYRSSALNLSNMENYDFLSGSHTYVDYMNDEGPVINSKRQLWSVAGYISMVTDIIFGIETTQDSIDFKPFIPKKVWEDMLDKSNEITLENLKYKDSFLNITLNFPESDSKIDFYELDKIYINGNMLKDNKITPDMLKKNNLIKIYLKGVLSNNSKINILGLENYQDLTGENKRKLFMPKEPKIKSLKEVNSGLEIKIDHQKDENILYNIYKNGKLYKKDLKEKVWIDTDYKKENKANEYIFSVANEKLKTKNPDIKERDGVKYLSKWGEKNEKLIVDNVYVKKDGGYHINLTYANAFHSVNTGITATVKWLMVKDENGKKVKEEVIFMPHRTSWNAWGESNIVDVDLKKNKKYTIEIIDHYNMSYFKHFEIYNGKGGMQGYLNKADIAKLVIEEEGVAYSVEAHYKDTGNSSHHSIPKKVK